MEKKAEKTRINKYLAKKGFATRLRADELIEKGKVFVNGKKAVLGQKVGMEDKVEIRGNNSAKNSYRYFAYNKPTGVVTNNPTKGEEAISDIFPIEDLFPIGRLDKNTEGLIILTNDGRITDRLLNPKYDHEKEYEVLTERGLTESFKKRMEEGVDIGEGEKTKPCKVELVDEHHFRISLTEGRRHQIKRMTEALFYTVRNLRRIRIMNIKLGKLATNQAREIKGKELEEFLKSLGL